MTPTATKRPAEKWQNMPQLAFDLETTGINVWEDRIVTAALVKLDENRQVVSRRTWLVNPGIDIPEGASEVHGITTEQARAEGMDPGQALYEITGQIALSLHRRVPLTVMNAAYDLTLLEVENRRHGISPLTERLGRWKIAPIIDPFVLDKAADPYRKGGRKLTQMCEHYGIPLSEDDAHAADADALAAARLWPAIAKRHPQLFAGHSLGSLHEAQVGWRREQMDSLRAYFDRKGTAHDGCDPNWPLQMPPAGTELPTAPRASYQETPA